MGTVVHLRWEEPPELWSKALEVVAVEWFGNNNHSRIVGRLGVDERDLRSQLPQMGPGMNCYLGANPDLSREPWCEEFFSDLERVAECYWYMQMCHIPEQRKVEDGRLDRSKARFPSVRDGHAEVDSLLKDQPNMCREVHRRARVMVADVRERAKVTWRDIVEGTESRHPGLLDRLCSEADERRRRAVAAGEA